MTDRWIVIPNWEKFQHYKTRDGESVLRPEWIKNYGRLLHDDAYRRLSFPQRAVLHGLWLEYAASGREIADDTAALSQRLGGRVTRATLDALNHAGYIAFSSRPSLEQVYTTSRPELEIEKEKALLIKGKKRKSEPELLSTGPRSILDRLRRGEKAA